MSLAHFWQYVFTFIPWWVQTTPQVPVPYMFALLKIMLKMGFPSIILFVEYRNLIGQNANKYMKNILGVLGLIWPGSVQIYIKQSLIIIFLTEIGSIDWNRVGVNGDLPFKFFFSPNSWKICFQQDAAVLSQFRTPTTLSLPSAAQSAV